MLDQLGNWNTWYEKLNGSQTVGQNRAHNGANEITDISNFTGYSWIDPTHDAAGNMTTLPRPSASTSSLTLTYDAWNRLVNASGTGLNVGYEYDGLNRLIVRTTSAETRHFYYNEQWQVVEERVGAAAATARPDVQYVWGVQYVDELVVRYRDADASGTYNAPSLEETCYELADANFNVTG